jgi:anti-sigma-K factor RskA
VMKCEELSYHYDLYALDIAEQPERAEIRAHLDRGCELCTAGVRHSLETAALIGASADPVQPSPQLRRRIMASIGSEEPSARWMPWGAWALATVALAIIAVYFAVSSRQYSQTAAGLRDEISGQAAQIARLTEAFAILSSPVTTEASFGGVQPKPPQGKVFVNPSRGVFLIASNLPRTSADKIYEMWLIPKAAKPIPAGLFQAQDDGNAMHIQQGAVNVAAVAAVAVTVENQAGADQPTSQPLIVASLPATPR